MLGIRGEDDPDAQDAGALLTDTIMVFSFDKKQEASIISYQGSLRKDRQEKSAKINSVTRTGDEVHKRMISKITGYI